MRFVIIILFDFLYQFKQFFRTVLHRITAWHLITISFMYSLAMPASAKRAFPSFTHAAVGRGTGQRVIRYQATAFRTLRPYTIVFDDFLTRTRVGAAIGTADAGITTTFGASVVFLADTGIFTATGTTAAGVVTAVIADVAHARVLAAVVATLALVYRIAAVAAILYQDFAAVPV